MPQKLKLMSNNKTLKDVQFKQKQNFPRIAKQIESMKYVKKIKEEDLHEIVNELRSYIIDQISINGGHIGSSLGCIEITVAIHRVFDIEKDKLIFDIGHQSYTHKILTRRSKISSIGQELGLSPFTSKFESKYDSFGCGHSSTSISAMCGFILTNHGGENISIIGDGAMSGGMFFEAMNNLASIPGKSITIVNDNGMSISKSVGAISNHLNKIGSQYKCKNLDECISVIKKRPDNFFNNFNLTYVGCVDGHDIHLLVSVLGFLKKQKSGHFILHIKTKKGMGMIDSKFECKHFIGAPSKPSNSSNIISYTNIASKTFEYILNLDPKTIGVSPAMLKGSMLEDLALKHPTRVIDTGISEQHAVTFCAGYSATSEFKSFCFLYSTFSQRAYDQIIHDVVIQKIGVVFLIDRSGLPGRDGSTHSGQFDVSFISCIPNTIIASPTCVLDLINLIFLGYYSKNTPFFVRYHKRHIPISDKNYLNKMIENSFVEVSKKIKDQDVNDGQLLTNQKRPSFSNNKPMSLSGYIYSHGSKLCILSFGFCLDECDKVKKNLLKKFDCNVMIANLLFAKPINLDLINEISKQCKDIVLIDEGSKYGTYSNIIQFIAENKIDVNIHPICIPDEFISCGTVESQKQMYCMTPLQIEERCIEVLNL